MSEGPDISALLSMLSQSKSNAIPDEVFSTFLNNMSSEKNSNDANTSNKDTRTNNDNNNSASQSIDNDFETKKMPDNMPDIETIMRLMTILKSSNQNSPDKNLLHSLKPFLNDSRKQKVDKYIKILGMTKALEALNELGDFKNE